MKAYVKAVMTFDKTTKMYELAIEGIVLRDVGVTCADSKDAAEYMVRDYVDVLLDSQFTIAAVDIVDRTE